MTKSSNQPNAQPVTAGNRFFYGYIVVAAAFLICLVTYGMQYSFGIFFKPLIAEFGWTRAVTSGALSLSWLVTGLMSVVSGSLNDKYGPRVVLSACGALSGAGLLLMSCVSTVWGFYLVYGVLIGTGISVFVPLMSTLVRWFVKRRTLMSGIVAASIGVGMLVLSPLTNALLLAVSWRSSYLILGAVVLVIVVGAAQFMRRNPAEMGQVAFGQDQISAESFMLNDAGLSLSQSIRTKQFWMILGNFSCLSFCIQSILAHLVPHITDLGISSSSAASILATIGIASIIGKVALGALGDVIGNRNTIIVASALMVLALVWLFFSAEMWRFYLFAVIFGLAYGGHIAQQPALIGAVFGLVAHGMIFSILGLGVSLGSAIGPTMTGYLFDSTGDYKIAFMVIAIVGVVGLAVAALVKSDKASSPHEAGD